MSKIMVIAGGDWQCPIVKKAKELGHYVVCSNLYENSPAFAYADEYRIADVRDKEKNLEYAREIQPDAIITDQTDISVPTVAYIAEKIGVEGIGYPKSLLFTNKVKMRDFCFSKGFPAPRYIECSSMIEAQDFFNEMKKPMIIKPIDSQSSRGIHIINSIDDINIFFDDAISYSNGGRKVIVEEYIDGTEFTVDGIKTKDSYYVTAISKKEHYDYNPNIAKKLLFSHYDEEYDYQDLRELNRRMVLAMGLPFGLTHAEYKYYNGEFYLIEIAARGGGTKISSDIVPFMSGIDTNTALINMSLNKDVHCNLIYRLDKYALLGFFDLQQGKVKHIRGIEKALHIDGVVDMSLPLGDGDIIKDAGDDRSRIGHYIISATSKKDLLLKERELLNSINIDYE